MANSNKTRGIVKQSYNSNSSLRRFAIVQNFDGNLATALSDSATADNQLKVLHNFDVVGGGQIDKRPGTMLFEKQDEGAEETSKRTAGYVHIDNKEFF